MSLTKSHRSTCKSRPTFPLWGLLRAVWPMDPLPQISSQQSIHLWLFLFLQTPCNQKNYNVFSAVLSQPKSGKAHIHSKYLDLGNSSNISPLLENSKKKCSAGWGSSKFASFINPLLGQIQSVSKTRLSLCGGRYNNRESNSPLRTCTTASLSHRLLIGTWVASTSWQL